MISENKQLSLFVAGKHKQISMSSQDAALAKILFKEWFDRYPAIDNPTDINKQEKYNYMVELGWKRFMLMQRARKTNTAINGYPFPWTRAVYWKNQKQKFLPVVG